MRTFFVATLSLVVGQTGTSKGAADYQCLAYGGSGWVLWACQGYPISRAKIALSVLAAQTGAFAPRSAVPLRIKPVCGTPFALNHLPFR